MWVAHLSLYVSALWNSNKSSLKNCQVYTQLSLNEHIDNLCKVTYSDQQMLHYNSIIKPALMYG